MKHVIAAEARQEVISVTAINDVAPSIANQHVVKIGPAHVLKTLNLIIGRVAAIVPLMTQAERVPESMHVSLKTITIDYGALGPDPTPIDVDLCTVAENGRRGVGTGIFIVHRDHLAGGDDFKTKVRDRFPSLGSTDRQLLARGRQPRDIDRNDIGGQGVEGVFIAAPITFGQLKRHVLDRAKGARKSGSIQNNSRLIGAGFKKKCIIWPSMKSTVQIGDKLKIVLRVSTASEVGAFVSSILSR
jgi:hypothetical protein